MTRKPPSGSARRRLSRNGARNHYCQPLWTLVGGGIFPREESGRDETDFIPPGAKWIREAAASIDPVAKSVTTTGGNVLTYDFLVVAAGFTGM